MRRRVVSTFFFSAFFSRFFLNIRLCCGAGVVPRRFVFDCTNRVSVADLIDDDSACFVLEQRHARKKNATKKATSTISKTELDDDLLLVRLLLESRRQKAGGRRREKKKLLKASFFCAPSFLGFQMLTFSSYICFDDMSDAVLTIL